MKVPRDLALTALKANATANGEVLILVLLGAFAVVKGVFDQEGISDLGRLVYHLSMPALIFSNIVSLVSVEALEDLASSLFYKPIYLSLFLCHAVVSSVFLLAVRGQWLLDRPFPLLCLTHQESS